MADNTVLVMHARDSRLRRWLGRRALAFVHTRLTDGCGRTLAVHVSPLIVELAEWPAHRLHRKWLAILWLDIERRAATLPDLAREAWLAKGRSTHDRFRRTRTAREQAIWRALQGGQHIQLQPGLFDHRAERRHQASTDRHAELVREAARRIEASKRLAGTHISAPRVVLLLVP